MATINIGSLTFTHKGDYASGTAYVKNDVVYYATNGNAYIAKTSTTGNAPTSTAHWDVFAAGSGGIWNAGLSLGTAGQVVKVNSGANALEFGAGGGVLSSHFVAEGNRFSLTGTNTTTQQVGGLAITLTPASTSSKFLLMSSFITSQTNYGSHMSFMRGTTDLATAIAVSPGNRIPGLFSEYVDSNDYTRSGSMQIIDSPNTTSSITYKVGAKIRDTNTWYWNRDVNHTNSNDHVSGVSTFQILELGV